MIVGALLALLIIGAFISIPLLALGWWLRRRGIANLKVVEAAYSEHVGAVRAA
jgi:hypothetical protein